MFTFQFLCTNSEFVPLGRVLGETLFMEEFFILQGFLRSSNVKRNYIELQIYLEIILRTVL